MVARPSPRYTDLSDTTNITYVRTRARARASEPLRSCGALTRPSAPPPPREPVRQILVRTNIMDFRGFDSNIILILRGGIPRPRKFESTHLSRHSLSREMGRTGHHKGQVQRDHGGRGLQGPSTRLGCFHGIPVSVKQTLLLQEPFPCNPAAEAALQPLIWCF